MNIKKGEQGRNKTANFFYTAELQKKGKHM